MNKRKTLTSLVLTISIFALISVFFDYRFDLNDDSTIKDILSGSFTGIPTGYAIYIQYPLGFLISLLYRLVPIIPWFSILIQGIHVLCLFLVINRLLAIDNRIYTKIISTILAICFFVGILLQNIIFTQYTVTSAILVATAIFLMANDDLNSSKRNAGYIAMCAVSFSLRSKVFILAIPYLGFVLFVKLISNSHDIKCDLKNYLKFVISTAGVLVLIFGIHHVAYSVNDWKEFNDFNAARTDLYDYLSLPDYDKYQKMYDSCDISKDDYIVLDSYNIDLNSNINTELLTSLNSEIKNTISKLEPINSRLKKSYVQYKYRTLHKQDYPWNVIMLALYVCWGVMIVASKKYRNILFPVLLVIMRSCIWMYIIFEGRYPGRITDSLYLLEIGVLSGCIIYHFTEYKVNIALYFICATVISILCISSLPNTIENCKEKESAVILNDAKYEPLMIYMSERPNTMFYLDVYSMVGYTEKMFGVQNKYQNYRLMGGWTSHSPLIAQKNIHNKEVNINNCFFVVDNNNLSQLAGIYYSFLDDSPVYYIDDFLVYDSSIK